MKRKNGNKGLTFSQAVEGFALACEARHLSPNTLIDYRRTFRKFGDFLDSDPLITAIERQQIEAFLAAQTVSKKTVLNYHVGLSALWTWALKAGYVDTQIVQQVERPKPEKRVIVPFTEADIRKILASLGTSRSYSRPGKKESSHSLPDADRNRAIILLLLDTGMRASELCGLKIYNVDQKNHRAKVFGKGDKERSIPFSPRTGQAIWKYLAARSPANVGEYLFITADGNPLDPDRLEKIMDNISKRSGVPDIYPHRWRHTFAVMYLRNTGDTFSLQEMLGHTTMEMVKRYVHLAQADLDNSHRRASPVDNLKL